MLINPHLTDNWATKRKFQMQISRAAETHPIDEVAMEYEVDRTVALPQDSRTVE